MSIVEIVQMYIGGDAVAGVILVVAAKATVLLALALAVNAALRSASASLRHLVWSVAIGAVLLVPAFAELVPRWEVPIPVDIASAEWPSVEPAAPLAEAVSEPSLAEPVVESVGAGRASTGTAVVWSGASGVGEAALAEPAPLRARAPGWTTWLVAIWLTGALLAVAAVLLGLARTWLMGRRAIRVESGPLARELRELSAAVGIRRSVALLRCSGPCMPMTWGLIHPVILMPADVGAWPVARLRSVLLHELAHVKRFDYLTQLLARFACSLHWFNPMAWLAANRLRIERELACDDQVLLAGSRASDYAEHLLDVARSLKTEPLTAMTTVAMARPSQLGDRLQAVLDATRTRRALTLRSALAVWAAALLIALPLAAAAPGPVASEEGPVESEPYVSSAVVAVADEIPTAPGALRVDFATAGRSQLAGGRPLVELSRAGALVPNGAPASPAFSGYMGRLAAYATLCDWSAPGESSTSIDARNDEWRVKISQDDCKLEMKLDGEFAVNEEETEIVSLESGGRIEIEEEKGRRSRKLRLDGGRGGSIERRWWVDGDEREFDDAARAWQADMVLVIYRRAGYQATERAERILARGGTEALRQEISQIPSDWTAGRYYSVLLSKGDLSSEELAAALRQIGDEIESDHQRGQLLIMVAESRTMDETVMAAYVDATRTIESDHQKGQALMAVLNGGELNDAIVAAVLQSSGDIDSDHQLAGILTGVAERYPVQGNLAADYLAAAAKIDSDHQRRAVLSELVKTGDLNSEALNSLLSVALEIDSDHQMAGLLTDVSNTYGMNEATEAAFFRAVDRIDSDFQRRGVLSAVVSGGTASDATLRAVLGSSLDIDSDHERASLLIEIVNEYTIGDDLEADYMRAADGIDSTHERNRVLEALYPRSSGNRRY